MRPQFLSISLLALTFTPALMAGAEPKRDTDSERTGASWIQQLESGKEQTVVAYGTSLTANGAWVKGLREALDKRYPSLATVINSGGSGKWSKWGVANLDRLVLAKDPDAVLIEFGINDSVERFKGSVEIAKANLLEMIDRILAKNPQCEIVLMTMTPGDGPPEGHRSYRKDIAAHYAMYREVAKARGLLLVDLYPEWVALRKKDPALFAKYVPDTIHPTAEGCSEVVIPAVRAVLWGER